MSGSAEQSFVLQVNHLTASYAKQGRRLFGKKEYREAVSDVSFDMRRGELVGLVGESGCGKTTLSKALLGMIPKMEGTVYHADSRPQMVFQDPYGSLNPAKKIGWILEEPLRMQQGGRFGNGLLSFADGESKAERRKKVCRMLQYVGLKEDMTERYPSQLSGGQRQRVCIAASLMLEPKLLIADEAVSALDVTVQKQIIDLFLELHQKMNLAILFISHDLRVVYRLCDRVIIMKDGRIVESGSCDEVYFSPRHAYTKTLLEAAGIRKQEEITPI